MIPVSSNRSTLVRPAVTGFFLGAIVGGLGFFSPIGHSISGHPGGQGEKQADVAVSQTAGSSRTSVAERLPKRVRHSSLLDQADEIENFLKLYHANPADLKHLISGLDLPEPLKSDVIQNAVASAAAVKPLETLQGIEGLPLLEARYPLIAAATAAWSKVDPEQAYRWAEDSTYPGALATTAAGFWKKNPATAAATLEKLSPEKQSNFLTAVLFSDVPLTGDTAKSIHQRVQALAALGDDAAAALETRLLSKQAAADPDYVEQYLDRQTSVELRDQVAPDLALARSGGDWAAANRWLAEYQDQRLTSATVALWKRWAESGDNSLTEYLASTPESEGRKAMVEYLHGLGTGSENLRKLSNWIDTHSRR